jgi:hypothetical protein
MPESNVETEFDGRRDQIGRFRHAHVADSAEQLKTLHLGESKKANERVDHFQGLDPLPTGLKKPKYATPKWKGSYVEDQK